MICATYKDISNKHAVKLSSFKQFGQFNPVIYVIEIP